jgi:thiol:disulfide interchange protein DsbA
MKSPSALRLLLACLLLPFAAGVATPAAGATPVQPLVEGEDYVLVDGTPWGPLDGKVEVVEVFAYTCPHCAEFEPALEAWARKLPADVRFQPLPAAYDPGDAYARAFFVAEQAGALPRVHRALFDAVHREGLLARNASSGELAWFLGQHGINEAKARAAMASPQVDELMRRARDFAVGIRLRGTPTLVVDGRYLVTPRSHADALRITDQLIARLRARH